MNTKKNKYCVISIRVSTSDQADNLSLSVQEKLCRKKAEEEGYQVLEVLREEGISGFKENRSSINRIKELIHAGKVSGIVALASDRLFRNKRGHLEMMELAFEKGIHVMYVMQPSPENTAHSKLTDSFISDVNQFFRDQTSDKVKDTLYSKVEAGYFPTQPSVGYININNPDKTNMNRFAQKIIAPHPVMASLITELFQLYATGVYNVYDLTDMMNRRGLRSHKGYELSPSRVYDLLKNRIYLGEVKWGKAYNKNGKHTPLIDEATFNQVQVVMETNNHKACRRRKYSWLLSGFLYCANHGKRYVAEWH